MGRGAVAATLLVLGLGGCGSSEPAPPPEPLPVTEPALPVTPEPPTPSAEPTPPEAAPIAEITPPAEVTPPPKPPPPEPPPPPPERVDTRPREIAAVYGPPPSRYPPQPLVPVQPVVTTISSDGTPEVDAVVRRNSGQLRYCYDVRQKDNPDLAGKIELLLTLEGGQATSAESTLNTSGDDALATCMLGKAKRWTFPAEANGVVKVTYQFGAVP